MWFEPLAQLLTCNVASDALFRPVDTIKESFKVKSAVTCPHRVTLSQQLNPRVSVSCQQDKCPCCCGSKCSLIRHTLILRKEWVQSFWPLNDDVICDVSCRQVDTWGVVVRSGVWGSAGLFLVSAERPVHAPNAASGFPAGSLWI